MSIPRKYILTPKKEQWLRDHYMEMTDEVMAKRLRATRHVVYNWRKQLGLQKRGMDKKKRDVQLTKAPEKKANLKRMTTEERREFFLRQLRGRPRYDLMRSGMTLEELVFYEQKYVEYFSDPSVETITVHEEDDLHELTMAQIRALRLQKEEFNSRASGMQLIDNSKGIKETNEIILKYKHSLDLERGQRLKRQEDSATNFTNLVRELNQHNIRRMAGIEATMLKFRMEESINLLIDHGLAQGIEAIPLEDNFINGKLPADYHPPEIMKRRDEDDQGKI